jgi:hypothetical protein
MSVPPIPADQSVLSFLTYTSLLGQQGGGGSGTPSNWSSYPALTNVNLGGNTMSNGLISVVSNALNISNPVILGKADTGNGNPDPAEFSLLRGTYVKHDPFGVANELFTLDIGFSSLDGWVMSSYWEGYIGMPLTIGGKPIRLMTEDEGVEISNVISGGSGTFTVDSSSNLFWNSNQLTPVGGSQLTNEQDFAVPPTFMALPIGGITSNFTGNSNTIIPTTSNLIVNAMVCVADSVGSADVITFGVAEDINPSSPLILTHTTVPASGVITANITGVIPVVVGTPITLVLVACSQSNTVYVYQSYAMNIVG